MADTKSMPKLLPAAVQNPAAPAPVPSLARAVDTKVTHVFYNPAISATDWHEIWIYRGEVCADKSTGPVQDDPRFAKQTIEDLLGMYPNAQVVVLESLVNMMFVIRNCVVEDDRWTVACFTSPLQKGQTKEDWWKQNFLNYIRKVPACGFLKDNRVV